MTRIEDVFPKEERMTVTVDGSAYILCLLDNLPCSVSKVHCQSFKDYFRNDTMFKVEDFYSGNVSCSRFALPAVKFGTLSNEAGYYPLYAIKFIVVNGKPMAKTAESITTDSGDPVAFYDMKWKRLLLLDGYAHCGCINQCCTKETAPKKRYWCAMWHYIEDRDGIDYGEK